jgi:hypothetical protein
LLILSLEDVNVYEDTDGGEGGATVLDVDVVVVSDLKKLPIEGNNCIAVAQSLP